MVGTAEPLHSRKPEQPVVPSVIPIPDDPDHLGPSRIGGDGVEAAPGSGKLEAKQVGEASEPFRYSVPGNPVTDEWIRQQPVAVLAELLSLWGAGGGLFRVDFDIAFGQGTKGGEVRIALTLDESLGGPELLILVKRPQDALRWTFGDEPKSS